MRTLKSSGPAVSAGNSMSRALVALPLVLAAFALLLQVSSRRAERMAVYLHNGMLSEHDYLPQPRTLVKVETMRPAAPQLPARKVPQRSLGADWTPQQPSVDGPKVAFVVTTSETLRQIKVWLAYHRAIGVSNFYIFVDGQAARPEVMAELQKLPGVKVVPRDDHLKQLHARSRIWNETWLSAFFHKPCNHELFVTQSLNMELAIKMARADKADWILHIDTDELVYPSGSAAFSLQEILGDAPADVDTLVFPNYESLPEREDVSDPFTEVTLFKKNYQHVVSELYFKNYHTIARGNPNYFITYGNGKSAARVQRGLRPNGAHRWHSYVKSPNEKSSDQAAVLHYTYNKFSDLKSRRDRCDCAPTEEDAKRCFILPFDRMAFLEASLKSDADLMQWFRDRLVWSDASTVLDLLKKGLLARLYEPQIMVRGFLAAMDVASQAVLQQPVPAQVEQAAATQIIGRGPPHAGSGAGNAVGGHALQQLAEQQRQQQQQGEGQLAGQRQQRQQQQQQLAAQQQQQLQQATMQQT